MYPVRLPFPGGALDLDRGRLVPTDAPEVVVNPRPLALLRLLAAHLNRPVPTEDVLDGLGMKQGDTGALDTLVHHTRSQVLARLGAASAITRERNVGITLVASTGLEIVLDPDGAPLEVDSIYPRLRGTYTVRYSRLVRQVTSRICAALQLREVADMGPGMSVRLDFPLSHDGVPLEQGKSLDAHGVKPVASVLMEIRWAKGTLDGEPFGGHGNRAAERGAEDTLVRAWLAERLGEPRRDEG